MKRVLAATAVCIAMMISGNVACAAQQGGELQPATNAHNLMQVVHKPKKQSTGSWKQHRDGHEGTAKQKKEKKWHKKESSQGQKNFAPKRFRK